MQNELREESARDFSDDAEGGVDMDGNTITMVGNLTRDIEIVEVTSKSTGEKIPKGRFSIARSWYVGEGENRTQRAEYFDCEVWREQALNLAASLRKGSRVIVHGTLRQDSWMVEVPGGEPVRRTKDRIEVIDAGPALRFATAEVTKNARPEPGAPVAVAAVEGTEEGSDVEFAEEPF